jgi:hypothetical protein
MTRRLVIELRRTVSAAAAAARRSALGRASARVALALLVTLGAPSSPAAAGSDVGMQRDPGGYGLILPGKLWVSGDLTLGTQVLEVGPASFEIDDVSLLARWEPTSRLALFGELRLEDLLEVTEGRGAESGDAEVVVERLYAEALVTPRLTLRVGKVFTPFGLWNVIHRAPLTWTVEEPAITEDVFPIHATGLSLLHQSTWRGWSLDATVYGPAQDEIHFQHPEDEGWLVGGRVAAGRAVGAGFAALGLNAAGFRSYDRVDWTTATGLDLEVGIAGHQITGELTFRIPSDGSRVIQGLYLQDAIPLEPLLPCARELYGVVRFEQFQPERGRAAVGGVVGLFWRPVPNVILKLD